MIGLNGDSSVVIVECNVLVVVVGSYVLSE